LELGGNQRGAEASPEMAMPEKQADGAGESLNLPHLLGGERLTERALAEPEP
jgi:hypothetical protein